MQLAIKKQLFSQNKIQVKKKRPVNPLKKTVKELLKEKRVDQDPPIGPTTNPSEGNIYYIFSVHCILSMHSLVVTSII